MCCGAGHRRGGRAPGHCPNDITRTILFAEAASAFEDLIESGAIAGLTAPEDRYTAYARDAILAKDYLKALRLRGVMAREADRVLAPLDALVAPGRSTVAAMLGGEVRSAIRGTARDVMGAVGNGAGLPRSVPNGLVARVLPTVGSSWCVPGETTILAAAPPYQSVTTDRRHPPTLTDYFSGATSVPTPLRCSRLSFDGSLRAFW